MLNNVNELQTSIIHIVSNYVKSNNRPIPQKVIIEQLTVEYIPECTAKASIRTLVRKGYLRKSVSHTASYVLLRTINFN